MPYPGLLHSEPLPLPPQSEDAQSCPTLCDPMDCSLPGSSVHGIFQVGILECVAISFSTCFHRRHSNTVLAQALWDLWVLVHTRFVWALQASLVDMGFDSNMILPLLPSCWGFSFALGCGYRLLVGFNILLLTVVQQWVIILEFLQEKMSTYPSTPSYWKITFFGMFGCCVILSNNFRR